MASDPVKEWLHRVVNSKEEKLPPSKSALSAVLKYSAQYCSYFILKISKKLATRSADKNRREISLRDPKLPRFEFAIVVLFKRILRQYVRKETSKNPDQPIDHLLRNKDFLSSLLVCCLESYFFVEQNTVNSFEELTSLAKVDLYDVWRQINYFATVSKDIPRELVEYFKEVECKILLQDIWNTESCAYRLAQDSSLCKEVPSFAMFCRRMLTLVAFRIKKIGDALNLPDTTNENV